MYKPEYTHSAWLADKILKKKYSMLATVVIAASAVLLSQGLIGSALLVAFVGNGLEVLYSKFMSKKMVNYYLYNLEKLDGVKITEIEEKDQL